MIIVLRWWVSITTVPGKLGRMITQPMACGIKSNYPRLEFKAILTLLCLSSLVLPNAFLLPGHFCISFNAILSKLLLPFLCLVMSYLSKTFHLPSFLWSASQCPTLCPYIIYHFLLFQYLTQCNVITYYPHWPLLFSPPHLSPSSLNRMKLRSEWCLLSYIFSLNSYPRI